jgi:hypothetical protein
VSGVLALSLLVPTAARAEASADDPQGKLEQPKEPPPAPQRAPRATWRKDGTWGWFLVASTVFVGGAISSIGLAITCDDGASTACERRAGMLLWGGIGLASVGSVIGLTVVAQGRDRMQAAPVALDFKPITRVCRAAPP